MAATHHAEDWIPSHLLLLKIPRSSAFHPLSAALDVRLEFHHGAPWTFLLII